MKSRTLTLLVIAASAGAAGYAALDRWAPWERLLDAEDEEEPLYYRHPHDPDITADEQKQDEMGMDYIPVYPGEEDETEAPSVVSIPDGVVQAMSVRTGEVEHGELTRTVEATGHVRADEGRTSHIDLRAEGWVESLEVAREGEAVEAGEVLFLFFSPRLLNAQEELLQAERSGRERDIDSAERRLRALGLGPEQIQDVRETGEPREQIPVRAPRDGVVTRLDVREGDRLAPGDDPMAITDLSQVWVIAEVLGHPGGWLAPGLHAKVTSRNRPGETLHSEVDYVYPVLDDVTRATRARLVVDNPDGELRPGMLARVAIDAEPTDPVPHIPREAAIRTGAQDRVIRDLGGGRFQAREVALGPAIGDRIVVEDGLGPGDRVVTSGQFLLDSEADVTAELLRLEGAEPGAITVRGRLEDIDHEAGEATIAHEPVPELEWPEMTMGFEIGEDVDLSDVSPGDAIKLAFEPIDGMEARLTAIEPDEAAEHEGDAPNGHDPGEHEGHDHGDHADHDHADHEDHEGHDHEGHEDHEGHDHGDHDHGDHGDHDAPHRGDHDHGDNGDHDGHDPDGHDPDDHGDHEHDHDH